MTQCPPDDTDLFCLCLCRRVFYVDVHRESCPYDGVPRPPSGWPKTSAVLVMPSLARHVWSCGLAIRPQEKYTSFFPPIRMAIACLGMSCAVKAIAECRSGVHTSFPVLVSGTVLKLGMFRGCELEHVDTAQLWNITKSMVPG